MAASDPEAQTRSKADQRAATRVALLEAGVKAFAAKGHDGVNLAKDVLEPAGISAGSFYHQFANKTELLLAIIELATKVAENRFYESLPDDRAGMSGDAVRESWDNYLSLVDRREDVVTIQLRETHSPHPEIADAIKRLTDLRRDHLASQYRRVAVDGAAIDAEALSEVVETLAAGALANYLRTPPQDRAHRKAEMVDRLTTATLAAVAAFTDPGD